MRNRSYILNVLYSKSECVQCAHSRFPAGAWPTDKYVHVFDAKFQCCTPGFFRRDLCGKRCGFTRSTKSTATGSCPRQRVTLPIGDRDNCVVEGSMYVGYRIHHMLFYLLFLCFSQDRLLSFTIQFAQRQKTVAGSCHLLFCSHNDKNCRRLLSSITRYRLIGRRGPFRVRALVRVRCPRTGRPRR